MESKSISLQESLSYQVPENLDLGDLEKRVEKELPLSERVNQVLLSQKKEYDGEMRKNRGSISINTIDAKSEIKALRNLFKLYGWKENNLNDRTDLKWVGGQSYWDRNGINEENLSQPVSKFPCLRELADKKVTGFYLNKFREYFPEEFDFFPRTFLLPEESESFQEYQRGKKSSVFICKPAAGSQGDGIFLIKNSADLQRLSGGFHNNVEYIV